jgi:hypothetical protein
VEIDKLITAAAAPRKRKDCMTEFPSNDEENVRRYGQVASSIFLIVASSGLVGEWRTSASSIT